MAASEDGSFGIQKKLKGYSSVLSMPLYDYRNKKTGKVKEYFIKIADRDQFQKDNPHLEQVISAPAVGNRFVTMGKMKAPSDFTSLLKRMKKQNPKSTINVR